jgi:hypothetical protein
MRAALLQRAPGGGTAARLPGEAEGEDYVNQDVVDRHEPYTTINMSEMVMPDHLLRDAEEANLTARLRQAVIEHHH